MWSNCSKLQKRESKSSKIRDCVLDLPWIKYDCWCAKQIWVQFFFSSTQSSLQKKKKINSFSGYVNLFEESTCSNIDYLVKFGFFFDQIYFNLILWAHHHGFCFLFRYQNTVVTSYLVLYNPTWWLIE